MLYFSAIAGSPAISSGKFFLPILIQSGTSLAERIRKQGLTYKILTPIACAWAEQMAYDNTQWGADPRIYTEEKWHLYIPSAIIQYLDEEYKNKLNKRDERNMDKS